MDEAPQECGAGPTEQEAQRQINQSGVQPVSQSISPQSAQFGSILNPYSGTGAVVAGAPAVSLQPQASPATTPHTPSATPTRVTLASMINPEEPVDDRTRALSPTPGAAAGIPPPVVAPKTQKRQPADPNKPKKPRKRKADAEPKDQLPAVANTIIVDGKPIAMKPAEGSKPAAETAPAKKRAKKEPSAAASKAKKEKKDSSVSADASAIPTASISAPTVPPKPLVQAAPASILDIGDTNASDSKQTDPPIIALHIPLHSPGVPPGKSQNILNVMRLCEDKYGWKRMHPNAKFALEEQEDEDLDEDDDGDDMEVDEDENGQNVQNNAANDTAAQATNQTPDDQPAPKPTRGGKGKSKVGKYDLNDPFIDDAELAWEEQRAATKDGFFVYYGPLIEEGQYARIERADGTVKRSRPGAGGRAAKAVAANSRSKENAPKKARGKAAASTAKKPAAVAIAPKNPEPSSQTPEPSAVVSGSIPVSDAVSAEPAPLIAPLGDFSPAITNAPETKPMAS
ncbi:unnamed protein product [Kuraishia capsulata CBS 1993]|uniref:Hpc2-related domain-containing protein n=1 Tax=Kuraishia capsulata CBS 1993 TaxID=1382522 RepID=W6MJY7_9ASCO|nr:uncharacterized protein KUCA_T00002274001 [Kuraishia capsulata CBS 1993]CDK26303.1 unnamed protein product [Kuraishia capsulata CBS 1993]